MLLVMKLLIGYPNRQLILEGPKLCLGITQKMVGTNAHSWAAREYLKWWQAATGCRLAKMLALTRSRQTTYAFALSLSRRMLWILLGLPTGHRMLNKHLTVMNTLCSVCIEEAISHHFLGNPAIYAYKIFLLLGHILPVHTLKICVMLLFYSSQQPAFSWPLV